MAFLARRRSSQASETCVYGDERSAQVWSLAFDGKRSAPVVAPVAAQQLAGCAISYLDLVETADAGESLRLYFDAEVDQESAEPLSSSLSVLELPPAVPSPFSGGGLRPCGIAGMGGTGGSSGGAGLQAAWAEAQHAWYPDAAFVCCGRPGHYQGCLVWGPDKTDAVLSALTAGGGCRRALAFAFGSHPADAAVLGRRPAHSVVVLAELPPSGDAAGDVWCRLPGASFEAVCGGLAEHHHTRLAELRLASQCALALQSARARGSASSEAADASDGSGSGAGSGAATPRGGGGADGAALADLGCDSSVVSTAPASAECSAGSTPTRGASRRVSHGCDVAGQGSGGLGAVKELGCAAASPFALLSGQGEFWKDEMVIVPCGGW